MYSTLKMFSILFVLLMVTNFTWAQFTLFVGPEEQQSNWTDTIEAHCGNDTHQTECVDHRVNEIFSNLTLFQNADHGAHVNTSYANFPDYHISPEVANLTVVSNELNVTAEDKLEHFSKEEKDIILALPHV